MMPPPTTAQLPVFSLDAAAAGRERLLETEWLLTNGLGGFAMGTAAGVPTRRYHALLVAALSPPVERVVALNAVVDRLILEGERGREGGVEFSTFRFSTDDPGAAASGMLHPDGLGRLVGFTKTADGTVEWVYGVEGERGLRVVRSVHLMRGRNAAAVTYRVEGARGAWRLESRPLVSVRDYHHLLREGDAGEMYRLGELVDGVEVRRGEGWAAAWPALRMRAQEGAFRADGHWWRRFRYEIERERGMDDREDLFCPGVFVWRGDGSARGAREMTLIASMDPLEAGAPPSVEEDVAARRRHVGSVVAGALARAPGISGETRDAIAGLAVASDDFPVVRTRRGAGGVGGAGVMGVVDGAGAASSIIAGYPWFADWGRDAMISVPGLCLATGRHAEALGILRTFAAHCRGGLIPNRFDDNTSEPYYNTADASLWFLHAATEYLRATGDRAGFDGSLRRACLDVVESYRAGTSVPASDHGGAIRMDPRDYLIAAGSEATQLTWMDARRDGVIFTPRQGKPVELSVLWHHGLVALAGAVGDDGKLAADLRSLGEAVGTSIRRRFFSEEMGCLYDRLVPAGEGEGGGGDAEWVGVREVRPNQIVAASLANSPLTREQGRAVVRVVRERLLTRHGLRTLDPSDPGYRGRFAGPMFERDAAYHTGTAWPWLLPALAEAQMRVEGFSGPSREEARQMLAPLVAWLGGEGGGQLPEVFDGDDAPGAPQRPGGCPAQAWSVAEVLRVLVMASGGG